MRELLQYDELSKFFDAAMVGIPKAPNLQVAACAFGLGTLVFRIGT
jgi:hypothetical protein